MTSSDKVLALELESIRKDIHQVRQEVEFMAVGMRSLDKWRTTMDMILKNSLDPN